MDKNDRAIDKAYAEYKNNEAILNEQKMSYEKFKKEMHKEIKQAVSKELKEFEKRLKKK